MRRFRKMLYRLNDDIVINLYAIESYETDSIIISMKDGDPKDFKNIHIHGNFNDKRCISITMANEKFKDFEKALSDNLGFIN